MFDVGFSELVLMAIVALVVLGPEKLPHAARVAGAWVGRIRRTVSNMQAEIEREVSAQEMRDRLQKEIDSVKAAGQDLNIKDSFQTITEGMQ
nr:twin-arginine translocase subunit TatB [Moraxellaceae bacterium]